MKKFLKDETIKALLRQKRRLEWLSWMIPLISICSLIVILILLSHSLLNKSLILIFIIIILIIMNYVFDFKITFRIIETDNKLNAYFEDKIIPKLLVIDNPTIIFNENLILNSDDIDKIDLFNNYAEYYSYFHYEGIIEGCKFTFDEVVFDNLVDYDTIGTKIFNNQIQKEINYHWYIIELKKEYPCEAIYKIDNFDNYESSLLNNYHKYDLANFKLNPDYNIQIYIKDLKYSRRFVNQRIIKVLNDEYLVYNKIIAIYLNHRKLHIVIEEFENLIDFNKSHKVTIDSLMADYKNEQRIIKAIVKVLNS